uniref:PNPLA domain-containing protein n=1 Tax=Globisporangium ultimum (strain ATCC 200006 / CBS 805.95 / DAOM BR144) TaxID=431595 RepID=K3WKG2_GLOUD
MASSPIIEVVAGQRGTLAATLMAPPSVAMPTGFSFACGGWLKMYLFGVAKALQEFELERDAQMIGCSAGALTATALAMKCDFDAIRDYVLTNVIPKAHATFDGPFKVREYLRDTLAATGKLHRYEMLNEKKPLTIVYTSLSAWASRRITEFTSRDHLEKSLLASCCAPPIAGMPFKMNGEWVMDGGLFDFQPTFDGKTVTVSPFYCTGADIKPSRYVPMWWAVLPPGERDVEWLFDLGYEDGLTWIVKSGLAGSKHVEIPTKGASYDGEWTTTVGRVLGYRGVESRVLDAMFVGLFVCLWKPLVFLLLYLELYLHVLIAGGKAAVFGAAAKLMMSSIVIALSVVMLATLSLQDTLLFFVGLIASGIFLGVLVLLCGGIHEAARVASQDWQKCQSCLRNITSLSLFLRSVPVYGASVQLKRHEFLLKHSFVYRVTLHFV